MKRFYEVDRISYVGGEFAHFLHLMWEWQGGEVSSVMG